MAERILLSHPHAIAVANAWAAALDRQGMLAAYLTGIAYPEHALLAPVERLSPRARNRRVRVSTTRLWSLAPVEAASRVLGKARERRGTGTAYDTLFTVHDAVVSRLPWPASDAVMAYEDAALQTLQRARSEGRRCIYDLAAPHYRESERVWHRAWERWPEAALGAPFVEPPWKQLRKEDELRVADRICVASNYARGLLADAGVDKPVSVLPFGFPVDLFAPRERAPDGPFTVVCVGSQDLRKGSALLLEAWAAAGLRDARLVLVGAMRLARPFLDRYAGTFEHVPHVPRAQLSQWYAQADVVVFPSLGDAWGLVVQEAMCTGTPVLAGPCGCGPDCITHGEDGWLVPAWDVDALATQLRWCAAHRDAVAAAGVRARQRAEAWTWQDAARAFVADARSW